MEKRELKQRKQTRLKGFNYGSHECVFFVTICTAEKNSYFSKPDMCRVIIDELEYRLSRKEIRLYCYCIMPDHLHILLSLEENYTKKNGAFGERTLQNWVSTFKRYTGRLARQVHHIEPLWQENFYDHVVRKDESLVSICSYILNNPVRKGMAPPWETYPYSRMIKGLPM